MDALTQLNALRGVYNEYLESYRQRVIDNGPLHGLQKFLLGNSTAADRKADNAFYHAVERSVDALRLALKPGDELVAEQAVRLMLLDTAGTDASSTLMIEAAQALAIPLLGSVPKDVLADILAAYQARYPKKRMLSPKQKELLAALEQAAK